MNFSENMLQDNKKEREIYSQINEFLQDVFLLKDSPHRSDYFKFMRKVSEYAPFNNSLVFMQNPDCGYYATAEVWSKKFNRKVKKYSRPMVTLVPFGPVSFVYDFNDTDGEMTDENVFLECWKEKSKPVEEVVLRNTLANLRELEIDFNIGDNLQYFKDVSFRTGGYARGYGSLNERGFEITLSPRYRELDLEGYGVMCHEIAHILLGHVGELYIDLKERSRVETRKVIAKGRTHISKEAKEFEAEIVAWLVFNFMGIEKNSEPYLATWADGHFLIDEINFVEVVKVAGKIQDMSKRTGVFR